MPRLTDKEELEYARKALAHSVRVIMKKVKST